MATTTPPMGVPGKVAVSTALGKRKIDTWGLVLQSLLLFSLVICLGFIIVLVWTVVSDGYTVFQDRGLDFLTSGLSTNPSLAGVWQGIQGSIFIGLFVIVLAFPLGIATSVYLEEYAPDNRLTRFVILNIRNLAGVPSVVYGLLGLAVFVELLGTDMGSSGGITGGRSLLSGGLTMAILVLPIVIITSSEAIRAVPESLREGGYGVGATRWEVTRSLVLPNALPGILTGTILALARALGETAPLILVGAFFGNFFVQPNEDFVGTLQGTYTALPVIIFNWVGEAQREFKLELAPAAILVLLGITLMFNLLAVILRNRYDKTW
ncbi:MAG: phosphate ABC transporter permease PstA [Acidimicrobiia bacterium]